MSHPSVSLHTNAPPYLCTRSHLGRTATPADNMEQNEDRPPISVMAEINTLSDQMRAMQAPDRLDHFCANTCDPHVWLSRFESLAAGKRWTNNKHEMLPIYMDNDAHKWFSDLPTEIKNDYDSLKAAFLEEYSPSNTAKFEAGTALSSKKQAQGEGVRANGAARSEANWTR